jgi:pyruvate/2-oxoglutarate dehydrogenase complex dihydrolipoamide dehydrogenase (E3) component
MGSSSSVDGGQCQQFRHQQSTSMPNIYAIGDVIAGDGATNSNLWGCFEAKQLMKKMFIGQLNPVEINLWA